MSDERILFTAADEVSAQAGPAVLMGPSNEASLELTLSAALAPRTREEYWKHWIAFRSWCEREACRSLPASGDTTARYLMTGLEQGKQASTLAVALAAISQVHVLVGEPSPRSHLSVRRALRRIRHEAKSKQARQKHPLTSCALRRMVDSLPRSASGDRDRALLLLGFAGGFRRSELVALDVEDLVFGSMGLEVTARRGGNRQGAPQPKVIAFGTDPATCPVRSLRAWLDRGSIRAGCVFRSVNRHGQVGSRGLTGHAVALIIKRAASAAGLATMDVSGHSLRAGFVVEAGNNGAEEVAIMEQTGHKSASMLERYRSQSPRPRVPASARLGL